MGHLPSSRRVANRESARRVRQKRQETMEEMQARMDAMQRQTAALTARLQVCNKQVVEHPKLAHPPRWSQCTSIIWRGRHTTAQVADVEAGELQEVEQHKAMLVSQLTSMRDKWSVAVNENMRLQDEVTRAPGSSPHQVRCSAILGRSQLQVVQCTGNAGNRTPVMAAACVPLPVHNRCSWGVASLLSTSPC